ncbi:hypothetical protein BS17DRAFT_787167 [Gyrodon lividus]|nr:hypothetical protein BS17DRAFT_787167 [Gyrodon lividus]
MRTNVERTLNDALTQYPMLPSESRVLSEKQILEFVAEYWSDKLGAMCNLVSPCSGCG